MSSLPLPSLVISFIHVLSYATFTGKTAAYKSCVILGRAKLVPRPFRARQNFFELVMVGKCLQCLGHLEASIIPRTHWSRTS